jgi:phosphoserine phosphatase
MTHVATLVSSPVRGDITLAAIATAQLALPGAGEPDVLAERIAVDISFALPAGQDPRALADEVRKAIAPLPIDVIVQPAAKRRKRLFLTDMDSTMIGQECIDELADLVGLKAQVAAITERAMRGEIEFEPALRERVALLAGLPVSVIDDVIRQRISLMPGGRALVHTMHGNGAHTFLVSGGFTLFTAPIAAMIGFDEHRANRLVIENGKLAGRVEEPILGRDAKLATLEELIARLRLEREDTLVAGDGANDIAMIAAAGLGVAYRAKPKVAAAAAARIDHADLTALLYAQGYRRDEFVDA